MRTVARLTYLVGFSLIPSVIALADVPSPETRHEVVKTEPSYTVIAICFAVAGALLFVWLGRRSSKK